MNRLPLNGDLELVRAALAEVDALERGLARQLGGLRRLVRRFVEVSAERPDGALDVDVGCRGCGVAIVQPEGGGRRIWCGEPCRHRHRRRTRAGRERSAKMVPDTQREEAPWS
jgi:hypothetical protein